VWQLPKVNIILTYISNNIYRYILVVKLDHLR